MTDYRALASSYAQQSGISPDIFVAQIQQESGFNPDATSSAGAIGIAQFMPETAKSLGLNPRDAIASLKAAARYDANNLKAYNGDYAKMLAAYNCGGGCVQQAVQKSGSTWLTATPSETQNYVKVIMGGSKVKVGGTAPTVSSSASGNALLDTLKTWGEYVAIFVLAAVFIIIGLLLLSGQSITEGAKKLGKAAHVV